jgi:hypothetical protein
VLTLWYEQEGHLYRLAVAHDDTSLVNGPIVRLDIALDAAGETPARKTSDGEVPEGEVPDGAPRGGVSRLIAPLARRTDDPGWYGATLFENVRHHLARGPLTAATWRRLPADELRRLQREMSRVASKRAAAQLLERLLGRFALPGLMYEPPWAEAPPAIATPALRERLAAALEQDGVGYVALDVVDAAALEALAGRLAHDARPLVVDLRDAWRGDAPQELVESVCSGRRSGSGAPRLVALVSEHTRGAAEALASLLQAPGCGWLIGRPTAGAAVRTETEALDAGGRLSVPVAPYIGNGGEPMTGEVVVPRLFVSAAERRADERWLDAVHRALR